MRFFIILFLLASVSLNAQDITVESIEINGLKRTKKEFLLRLIKTKVDQPYDSLKVATDIERLNRLPAIAKATEQTVINGNTAVITYDIVENFTIIPGVRTSQANDDSFAFRLSLFEFNFLGRNQLIGGFYSRNIFDSYGAFWEAPFLFTNKLGLGVNFQNNVSREPIFFNNQVTNYKRAIPSAEVYVLYEKDFHNKFELGLRYSQEDYEYLDGTVIDELPQELDATKWTVLSEYEHNHLVIDYQYVSGYRNLFVGQYVFGGTGLLNDALIVRNDTEYFKKIGKRGNLASRLRLGFASFNDTPFTPFVVDNQFNIRGAGNVVGRQTAELILNTEYRHTLIEKDWFVLQSNTFIDAGAKRLPENSISSIFDEDSTNVYGGVGIRFIHKRIFNAVIRLDYGVRLVGTQNSSGIVFGIGQYF